MGYTAPCGFFWYCNVWSVSINFQETLQKNAQNERRQKAASISVHDRQPLLNISATLDMIRMQNDLNLLLPSASGNGEDRINLISFFSGLVEQWHQDRHSAKAVHFRLYLYP